MNKLCTVWGENLDLNNVLTEYPRPQMVRDNYRILNGYWDYAYGKDWPNTWDGNILVPFSPETALSGVGRQTKPGDVLWYRCNVDITGEEYRIDHRLLLQFGAVDQRCEVYVNRHLVGTHVGGYLPFTCDITDVVTIGDNELVLRVEDDSDHAHHARGKQKLKRGGMFYTATSGIWQTVWMEWVPKKYIQRMWILPDVDAKRLDIQLFLYDEAVSEESLRVTIYDPQTHEVLLVENGSSVDLSPLPKLQLWTPQTPWLYDIDVVLTTDVGVDRVHSYFALRTFSLEKQPGEDFPRICLNHEPIYQRGVLDQGYWPESMLTPPSDEAMIFDITQMKNTGYNMVRKHIKIEPDRWYYHCDRLGLMVWQDMINGGDMLHQWFVTYVATPLAYYHVPVKDHHAYLLSRTQEAGKEEFRREVVETIQLLKNHPSICTWVIFNEGWGQFDTKNLTNLVRKADPTRLIDQASGWFDQRGGDFRSEHNYFFKLRTCTEPTRAYVLSEVGGRTCLVHGHSQVEKTYGYSKSESLDHLNEEYDKLQAGMDALIPQGLCASVYTQWTDIEDEINGVYTYDRKVRKISEKKA
ncbi:MAG: glycoside hydrolase family 2 [Lachnospiraceae bacterium]|nr:glycoside hydrolase family 2 [Lachnospiraceae bacterium]